MTTKALTTITTKYVRIDKRGAVLHCTNKMTSQYPLLCGKQGRRGKPLWGSVVYVNNRQMFLKIFATVHTYAQSRDCFT